MKLTDRLVTCPTDREDMLYVVSLSGGKTSAIAADRVLKAFPRERVLLWFADTLWEDDDLYRFLDDLEAYWDKPIIRQSDGRTPLQVADDHRIIPSSYVAPCSIELKVKMFERFIETLPKPLTVCLGFDFMEWHRVWKPLERYEALPGVWCAVPLMWKPSEMPGSYNRIIESWGIKLPRLYELGFNHNNCGGRCVRQGVKAWQLLHQHFPERFEEVANWERERSTNPDAATYGRTMMRRKRKKQLVNILLQDVISTTQPLSEVADVGGDDRAACICIDV